MRMKSLAEGLETLFLLCLYAFFIQIVCGCFPVESLLQFRSRTFLHARQHVTVGVHRDADACMSEALSYSLLVFARDQ